MHKLDETRLRLLKPGVTLFLYPVSGPEKKEFDCGDPRQWIRYIVIRIHPRHYTLGISIDGSPPYSMVISRTSAQLIAGFWWLDDGFP